MNQELKLQQIAAAAAGAYSLGLNPMPEIRRRADAGNFPRIHYYAGQISDGFAVGDFLLCLHHDGGDFEVEIFSTSLKPGTVSLPGPAGVRGGAVRFEGAAPENFVNFPGGGVVAESSMQCTVEASASAPAI